MTINFKLQIFKKVRNNNIALIFSVFFRYQSYSAPVKKKIVIL